MTLSQLVAAQRAFFRAGHTRPLAVRLQKLRQLDAALHREEGALLAALQQDLGKSPAEGLLTELQMLYQSLREIRKNLSRWARPQRVSTPVIAFPAASRICYEPLGTVLLLSPWNYPCLLAFDPIAAAVAAGNTFVAKLSPDAPATAAVVQKIIAEIFPPAYGVAMMGDIAVSQALLRERFDLIFYTGGEVGGRAVLTAAARHLTPTVLELGGKSPCIVDASANLRVAARRIVWGKFLNAGQTCVAPDFLYAEASILPALQRELIAAIREFYGDDPCHSPRYPRIVSRRHLDRLCGLLEGQPIAYGGTVDREALRLSPTLLTAADWNDPILQEEIFGPILPILPFCSLDEVIETLSARPKPLALYLFTRRKAVVTQVWEKLSFGGGCVNDTVLHLANPRLPFGGVGGSGMGSYHGRAGFLTFSHCKSGLFQRAGCEISLRYPPHWGTLEKLLRHLS